MNYDLEGIGVLLNDIQNNEMESVFDFQINSSEKLKVMKIKNVNNIIKYLESYIGIQKQKLYACKNRSFIYYFEKYTESDYKKNCDSAFDKISEFLCSCKKNNSLVYDSLYKIYEELGNAYDYVNASMQYLIDGGWRNNGKGLYQDKFEQYGEILDVRKNMILKFCNDILEYNATIDVTLNRISSIKSANFLVG